MIGSYQYCIVFANPTTKRGFAFYTNCAYEKGKEPSPNNGFDPELRDIYPLLSSRQ